MSTKTKRRFSETSGPWTGVNDAQDPGEVRLTTLYDAENVFFADAARGGGVQRRPAITGDAFSATHLGQSGNRIGQCVYDHTEIDGTIRRFFFCGSKVYRWVPGAGAPVDVTPVGVAIGTNKVFCNSLAGKLVVNDGTNRPWVGTNLGATPITGTYIDYDSAGTAWTASGRPAVFGGAVAFIANSLAGVSSKDTLLWSAPANPSIGYKQTNYAKFWELFQTSTDPITAILGTNAALYYFRSTSIGAIPGPTLDGAKAAATHDAVSITVGCTSPATVVLAGNYIFFADILGRPYRMPVGGQPEDLSWQLRRTMVNTSYRVSSEEVGLYTWGSFLPDLGLVVFALWPTSAASPYPQELFVFSATTGLYQGRWWAQGVIDVATARVMFEIGGVLRDLYGNWMFFFLGSDGSSDDSTASSGNARGYIYLQYLFGRTTFPATTAITSVAQWADNTNGPAAAFVLTHALACDDQWDKGFDRVIAEVSSSNSDQTWSLNHETPQGTSGALTAVAPALSGITDSITGVARVVWGIQGFGRYLRAKITFAGNTTARHIRAAHRVRADGFINGSAPETR